MQSTDRDIKAYLNTARVRKGKNKGKGIDPKTARIRKGKLERYAEWLEKEGFNGWMDISPREIGYYMSDLEDDGVYNLELHIHVLNVFYDYLIQDYGGRDNPARIHNQNVSYVKSKTKRSELDFGTGITGADFELMLENVGPRYPERDYLILMVLGKMGLRRSELAELKVSNVHYQREKPYIEIPGTKSEPRPCRIPTSWKGLFRRWIVGGQREAMKQSYESDYLFITDRSPKMSGHAIAELVHKIAQKSEIQEKMYNDASGHTRWLVTPHQLRHHFGKWHMTSETGTEIGHGWKSMDLKSLSDYMGHASVEITADIYGNTTDSDKLRAQDNYMD